MKLGKVGKIMAIGASTTVIISGIAAGVIWLSSSVVWAGEYSEDRKQQTEILLEMRIDITQDQVRRATNPEVREYLKKRLDRYESRLRKLQGEKIDGD